MAASWLVQSFLEQSVLEGAREWVPEQGTPQGAVISRLLSNIYLDPLDHLMAGQGFEMVRYADDFVVLCRSPEDAVAALAVVQNWTASAGLQLHPVKTRLVDANTDGFDFLGYHFEAGQKWPRQKSLTKFKDTVRAKTRRTAGRSLAVVIGSLNPTLRGWFEYFKHSRRWTFRALDGWIRRRLRSLLRKQQKRRGMAGVRGEDQRRWPNAFFADHGLFSLQRAYETVRQSS
jgi:RNA-directed DNA polymerase